MDKIDINFQQFEREIKKICQDFMEICLIPGPTRCVAKLTSDFDPRIGKKEEFPFYKEIKNKINRFNKERSRITKNKLFLFQDYGNLILVSGFKSKPTLKKIKSIPFVLASHADEITYMVKKNTNEIIPIFNAEPLIDYKISNKEIDIMHPEVKVWGFDGCDENRKFIEIGSGEIKIERISTQEPKKEFTNNNSEINKKNKYKFRLVKTSLLNENRKVKEGDLIIQDYNKNRIESNNDFNINTIFHMKAIDDRAGVFSHIYTLNELNKYGIKAKVILLGDEEGVKSDVAWAKLARPVFRKYCKEENIIIICDGFDGKQLKEAKNNAGIHMEKALITPYRSNGKGAGDPGLFALFRDEIIKLCNEKGFSAVTTTDYVSRSFDPKIMDDFPIICSIDWSNGPILFPNDINPELYYPICHVDESISIKQIINIIGTTFITIWYLYNKMKSK